MQVAASLPRPPSSSNATDYACFTDDWSAIRRPEHPLVVQRRAVPLCDRPLLTRDPFTWRASGAPDRAAAALGDLPAALVEDIAMLATRLAALMLCEEVRLRLELVDDDSCRKLHADFTDLRLITTYAGRGTQFACDNVPGGEVWNIDAGDIALVKGWQFGEGHDPCLHRSPPIAGTGERRLLLAIDTPRIDPEPGA
ncbi:DUF1826 domain-containing protein [Citromicrobium bathyomarinum]|uniref:DUF1826 domain-containing protein n=1 Tax=Citromicrobium bathyomarinum TaxID=72174 RepID=UPI001E56646E|nr:DUF1826 domain-containing protein [Citromicrobium bathyomarinum]MCD1623413.1 DUF1826 domain-containing protein [Citromicrobium bathyomarinum]